MAALEPSRVSAAKLALAVKRLRAENKKMDLIASDPIAVIGMGCRFPGGGDTPEDFWTALRAGRDAVREVPVERWHDSATLPLSFRCGGYLAEVDGFDAAYFGISPREAQQIDPQQRLLLEVVWESLWDAGIEPSTLTDKDAGVFVAIYNNDYARLQYRDVSALPAQGAFGSAHSIAAGRISFLLNTRGPCLALDSACSSSLVATHLACQSLRTGESSIAIVGASSLKLLSDEVVVFSKWGMLASDGKCKTFDASADGFGPGEGSGAVILKRLSDALQDGDRIRAVIRGSAVNHDGRSTVLTAPNGLAQEAVLRAALASAMLDPEDVSFIEAHGTGTSLGDPIEVEAIRSVYGSVTPDQRPCVLGAVKTNLGHLEAAAGLAGLIKVVLCLEHREIPKNLGFRRLNPEISLDGTRLKLATENQSWAPGDRTRVAGVSSFGLGGTNSHVLVEEAPVLPARPSETARQIPLPAYKWQRKKFWLAGNASHNANTDARSAGGFSWAPVVHPLLGRCVDSPFVHGTLFATEVGTASMPYLADHRLGDRPLLPFAAFLDLAAMAAREHEKATRVVITDFVLREPCFVSVAGRELQVRRKEGSIEIASRGDSGWTTHAKCSSGPAETDTASTDIENLRARCPQSIAPDAIYRSLEQTGLRYGPAFRTIQAAWSGEGEALARVELSKELVPEAQLYGFHPALLDGCLQVVSAARGAGSDDLFLPIVVDRFELEQAGVADVWVHAKLKNSGADSFSADLVLMDDSGRQVACLMGFTAKRTGKEKLEPSAGGTAVLPSDSENFDLSYELAWRASPRTSPVGSRDRGGERWLLVENREGSCRALADALTKQGATCETIRDVKFRRELLADLTWKGVVYDAHGLGTVQRDLAWPHPEKPATEFVLEFSRALSDAKDRPPQLWIISGSAVAVLPNEDVGLEAAPLWGLVRTLAVEYPDARPVLIDIGSPSTGRDDEAREANSMLTVELDAPNDRSNTALDYDPMVAFRGGVRYVARLVHSMPLPPEIQRLELGTSGRLEDIRIESAERRDPLPNEVEIDVRAAGLNFRDVLTALGMVPRRTPTPGAECSGIIARVGSNVQGFKVGDPVLALAPGSFQSFISVPAEWVTNKPAEMTLTDAAGIPVAFLTALYGLDRLAHLSAGQRVLIHAATGGLGMAAVELAMRAGAEVFATAGSPAKRELLQQLGVEHVFDSRSLEFRDQILGLTGGTGVDVVLNSLAGDFLRASFDVVTEGGCFLEVGKRGIWTQQQVEALGKSIRYFPFDLGDVAVESPSRIAEMLSELMQRFGSGDLHPLPTSLYSFEKPVDAFRTMAQARHIGKLVLGFKDAGVHSSLHDLVSNGTVLITGGLGALGRETARWLAEHGARKIVLVNRRAAEGSNSDPLLVELRGKGVAVSVERADVADPGDLEKVLSRIRASGLPLCAVFHAAGVVRDSVLRNASWASYREVTAPKIEGAWNLHRLTEKDPVRLMVFFSSAASILGSPGQGSYSAGNAFLDALAHHRASRGLRSLSVNWGAWASAGMAARLRSEQTARWARQGSVAMEPASALAALERAIDSGRSQVAAFAMDWERFLRSGSESGFRRTDASLFCELATADEKISQVGPTKAGGESNDAAQRIRSAPELERRIILATYIRACARRALGFEDRAAIQEDVPLQDVGLDSLMALEMKNELAQWLGVPLPAGLLFDYPSVDQLTQHLLRVLDPSPKKAVKAEASFKADLDALSDAEAERILSDELDRMEREKTNA